MRRSPGQRRHFRLGAQQRGSCAGYGPLGRGRTLGAKFQRIAVLALGGAEMAAGGADHLLGMTAVQQHPCQAKTFAHGGAGPVQADEGDSQLPGRKGRGDDLVQQVAAQQKLHVLDPLPPLLDRHGDSVQIQLPFRQFEALLPVHFVLGHMVKAVSQRPLPFLAAHKGALPQRAGRDGSSMVC